jgi:nicotinamidase-related amidase
VGTGRRHDRDGERLLDVDDTVLCVVDVQPGFLRKLGSDAEGRRVAGRIAWIVRVAVQLDVPVVVTEEEPERNGRTVPEILERVPADARLFAKSVFGLADAPEILAAVDRTERRTIALVGLETDVCVAHSALGLLDRGYRVAVVRDATASPGEAHEAGIDRMRWAGAVVMTTKSLYYEWLRTVERARVVEELLAETSPPADLIL